MSKRHLTTVLLASVCTVIALSPAFAMVGRDSNPFMGEEGRAPPTSSIFVDEDVPMERGHDGTRVMYDMAPDGLSDTSAHMIWPERLNLTILGAEFMEHGDLMCLQNSHFPKLQRVLLPSSPELVQMALFGVEREGFRRNLQGTEEVSNLIPFFLPASALEILTDPEYATAFGERTWVVLREEDLKNDRLLDHFFSLAPRFPSLNLFLDMADAGHFMMRLSDLPLNLERLYVRTGFFTARAPWFERLKSLNLRTPALDRPLEWEMPEGRPLALEDLIIGYTYAVQTPQTLSFFLRSLLAASGVRFYGWEVDGQRCPLPALEPLVESLLTHRKALVAGDGDRAAHETAIQEATHGFQTFLEATADPVGFERLVQEGLTAEGRRAHQGIQDGTLQVLENLAPIDYVILGRQLLTRVLNIVLPATEEDAIATLSGLDMYSFRVQPQPEDEVKVLQMWVPASAYTPTFYRALLTSALKERVKRLNPLPAVPSPVTPALQALRERLPEGMQRLFDARGHVSAIRLQSVDPQEDILNLQQVPFNHLQYVIFPDDAEKTKNLVQSVDMKGFSNFREGRQFKATFWLPIQVVTAETLATVMARADAGRFFIFLEKGEDIRHLERFCTPGAESAELRLRVQLNSLEATQDFMAFFQTLPLNVHTLAITTPFFDWRSAPMARLKKLRLFVPKVLGDIDALVPPEQPLPQLESLQVTYMDERMALPSIRFFLQTLLNAPNIVEDSLRLAENQEGADLRRLNEALDRFRSARKALADAAKSSPKEGGLSPEIQDELMEARTILGDFLGEATEADTFAQFLSNAEASDRDDESQTSLMYDAEEDEERIVPVVSLREGGSAASRRNLAADLDAIAATQVARLLGPGVIPVAQGPHDPGAEARMQELYTIYEGAMGPTLEAAPPATRDNERAHWHRLSEIAAQREKRIREKAEEFFTTLDAPTDQAAMIRAWGEAYARAENDEEAQKALLDVRAIQWMLGRYDELKTSGVEDAEALKQAQEDYMHAQMGERGRPPIAQIYDQIFTESVDMSHLGMEQLASICHQTWLEAAGRHLHNQVKADRERKAREEAAHAEAVAAQAAAEEARHVKAREDAEMARIQERERRLEVDFQAFLKAREITVDQLERDVIETVKQQLRERIQEDMERHARRLAEYEAQLAEIQRLRMDFYGELVASQVSAEDAKACALMEYPDPPRPLEEEREE